MVLEINLEVVSRPNVCCDDCNATRRDAQRSPDPHIVRFDVVKSRSQFDVTDSLRHFYQAEVLVSSPIPPHLIVASEVEVEEITRLT